MLQKIKTYIAQNRLLAPDATVIAGLSGGADSVAMLDALTLLGYRCVAAHCNFHLRGEESDRDADFAKKWCKSIDIEFVSIDFDTKGYAADKKISIEMAARELRYAWFEIVRQQFDAQSIVVAHHQDDSVETVLLNLVRGTGIKGLTGISPKNGRVARPMLCVTRAEINAYVAERNLPHVTDSSNGDDVYVRNFLRLNVIPKLQEINPSVKDAIARTARHVAEAEKMYIAAAESAKNAVFDGQKIHISKLLQTPSPASVLFEILTPLGFNPSVVEDVFGALNGASGKVFLAHGHRLIKDRDYLLLHSVSDASAEPKSVLIHKETREILAPIPLKISLESAPISIEKNPRFLYADADKLSFPLTLRQWRAGDWFVPFGMKGRKKLSDFFTDQKFSLKDKEETWVLLSGQDVVWIAGHRADNRFRVTSGTKNVLFAEILG